MQNNQKQLPEYQIRVHLVRHQVFYTALYLCTNNGSDLTYEIKRYKESDKELVKELFNETPSEEDVIDLFITGGPDVTLYLLDNPQAKKEKIYYWMAIVDRLPIQMITKKHKNGLNYDEIGIRNFSNDFPDQVFSYPEDTTLHYFTSKYYDKNSYTKKYLNGNLTGKDKIIEQFEKYRSILNDKLRPQETFSDIDKALDNNPSTLAFSMPEDYSTRRIKKFVPPMEVIAFTCIYTKKDIWLNEDKRNYLESFLKHVSLNINQLHEFNEYYEKDILTRKYRTQKLEQALSIYFSDQNAYSTVTDEQKQRFISNLKYLAQNRVFAVNLQTDLELKSRRFLENQLDKEINPFSEFQLYYWMARSYVVNAQVEIRAEADKKLRGLEQEKNMIAFLKSISASTHAIKTTLNFLFSSPLNSLKESSNDYRIQLLIDAKETLLLNAELVNLISKLSINNYTEETTANALIDSRLFAIEKTKIDLVEFIRTKLSIWHLDPDKSLKTITLVNTDPVFIPDTFLQYKNLGPTYRFFEMIVLTVIENCAAHGATKDMKINFEVRASSTSLVFTNLSRDHTYTNKNELTGNLKIIDSLLKALHIGEVQLELDKKNMMFYTKILAKT